MAMAGAAVLAACSAPAVPGDTREPAPPSATNTTPDASVGAAAPSDCTVPGCADKPGRVVTTSSTVEVLPTIVFPIDGIDLNPQVMKTMTAIADTMNGNPGIHRVDVQGHADGSDAHPEQISQHRADVVRQLLIRAGVDPNRLTATGQGKTRLGRTVQFVIVWRP